LNSDTSNRHKKLSCFDFVKLPNYTQFLLFKHNKLKSFNILGYKLEIKIQLRRHIIIMHSWEVTWPNHDNFYASKCSKNWLFKNLQWRYNRPDLLFMFIINVHLLILFQLIHNICKVNLAFYWQNKSKNSNWLPTKGVIVTYQFFCLSLSLIVDNYLILKTWRFYCL